jgi:hypothetical protein
MHAPSLVIVCYFNDDMLHTCNPSDVVAILQVMGTALTDGIAGFTVPMRDVKTGGTRSFECKVGPSCTRARPWPKLRTTVMACVHVCMTSTSSQLLPLIMSLCTEGGPDD